FDLRGSDGIIDSTSILKEGKAFQTEAIYLRFLEYEMHNSNEGKLNFVAVYDGSSLVEHLKNKYCSTVANDIMLVTSVGVIRMWADQGSQKRRFRFLFTTFLEQKRKASILDNLDHTNVTIILFTCGLVVVLLIVASIIQVKQPRKKYIITRDDFEPTLFHEAFEPPHYELCTLQRAASAYHMTMPSYQMCHHTTPSSRRNILMMKHSYSQDGQDGCDQDDDVDDCPTTSHHVLAAHRSMSNDF
ncbi:unnamed protein product, partial [Coregonus sp. 'balchen']